MWPVTLQHKILQVQLGMIHFIGKPQLRKRMAAHIEAVYSLRQFISLKTTRSRYLRVHLQQNLSSRHEH